ncbi:MAG: hypothetical protein ACOYCB_02590 [Fastidiosipilaceae bacterium]|nr:hypothetical protein [Clostridiaceae bacterium]
MEQGNLAVKYKSTQRKAVDPQITLLLYGKYRRTNARLSLKSETIKRTTDIVQHNSDQVTTESSTQPYKIRPNKSVSGFRRWWLRMSRRHTRSFIFAIAIIFIVTLLCGILLLNQSRVVKLSFANAEIENQIENLTISNTQQRSELLKRTDLVKVRERAYELGLIEPGEQQVRYVEVPQHDELIIFPGGEEK